MNGELVAEIVLDYLDTTLSSTPLAIVIVSMVYQRHIVAAARWFAMRLERQGGEARGPFGTGLQLNAPIEARARAGLLERYADRETYTVSEIEGALRRRE